MQTKSRTPPKGLFLFKALEDLKWHYMSQWKSNGHDFEQISAMVRSGEPVKRLTTSGEGRLLIHLLRIIHNHADAASATAESPATMRPALLSRRQIDCLMARHAKEYHKTLTHRLFFFLNTSYKYYSYGSTEG